MRERSVSRGSMLGRASLRPRRVKLVAGAVLLLVTAACSSGSDTTSGTSLEGFELPDPGTFALQVASYEPVAGRNQRFIAGVVSGEGTILAFGQVRFGFAYLGTAQKATATSEIELTRDATFLLVAGQTPPADATGPRLIAPSDGLGVYGTDVLFDRAGFWGVQINASVGGKDIQADATFEVFAQPINPFPGQPAPRTENRLPGAAGVDPKAIDSRAADDGIIPDPELHATTIAAAIAERKPVMVVVSTPVYCISRFCGPITDSVQQLAQKYGTRMAFVHNEVWNNFETRALNREAAEWIYREGADPKEPWVFLVDRDGNIAKRRDNVSTDDELESAVKEILG
jgi:hypothetical protein